MRFTWLFTQRWHFEGLKTGFQLQVFETNTITVSKNEKTQNYKTEFCTVWTSNQCQSAIDLKKSDMLSIKVGSCHFFKHSKENSNHMFLSIIYVIFKDDDVIYRAAYFSKTAVSIT